MATTKTAADIYQRAREKADQDQPGTGPRHVDDAEARSEVNESLARLWDVLVEAGGDELLRTDTTVAVTAGSADVALTGVDIYKLLSVDLLDASGEFVRELERVEWARRNDFTSGSDVRGYSLHGWLGEIGGAGAPLIRLWPTPATSGSLRIWYVPESPVISADADKVTMPNAWWQWVIVDVAIQLMSKAEEDASALRDERERLTRTIARSARRQDHGQPRRVQVRCRFGLDPRTTRDRLTRGWW